MCGDGHLIAEQVGPEHVLSLQLVIEHGETVPGDGITEGLVLDGELAHGPHQPLSNRGIPVLGAAIGDEIAEQIRQTSGRR